MAVTIVLKKFELMGRLRTAIADITFDSSYPTGGEVIALTNLGLSEADVFLASNTNGYSFSFDLANDKLKAYQGSTEVTNGTDLSSVTTRVIVWGI